MGAGVEFPYGATVYRDRKGTAANPYNPDRPVPGAWNPALTIEIEGAYIGASSSTLRSSATRQQVTTEKSLYLDAVRDVRKGDRIRLGGTVEAPGEHVYFVHVNPVAEPSPFTGDLLSMEIPLEMTEG